jgi:RHS repeat-associated protein
MDVFVDNLVINLKHGPLVEQKDYYAFGMENPALSTQAIKYQYNKNRYDYNGKEIQTQEFSDSSGLNEDDYGARFYDPVNGRFTTIDPHEEKYQSLSPYDYVADDPIKFVDENGRDIIIPKANRAAIVKDINLRARGTFAVNSKGHLYEVSSKGAPGFSTDYRDKLEAGIKSSIPITVTVAQKYTINGQQKDVDADAGGGVTLTTSKTTTDKNGNEVIKVVSEEVVISGNSLDGLQDTNGKPLRDDLADILAHEMVGHAIPHATKPDTGNAVDNENKVRAQEGPGKNAQRTNTPRIK